MYPLDSYRIKLFKILIAFILVFALGAWTSEPTEPTDNEDTLISEIDAQEIGLDFIHQENEFDDFKNGKEMYARNKGVRWDFERTNMTYKITNN